MKKRRLTTYARGFADFLDGVDTEDSDAVAGHNLLTQVTVAEHLQVARNLALWDAVGQLLQLEHLEVNAAALVRDDEIGI